MAHIHALLTEYFPGIPWAKLFPLTQFNPADPNASFSYWPNLLGYALLGLFLYCVYRRQGHSGQTLRQFLFPAEIYKTAVFRLEAMNYVVLGVLGFFLTGAVLALQTEGILQGFAWFHRRFDIQPSEPPQFLWHHKLLLTVCLFVGKDFCIYWYHRLVHANAYLWEFHMVHHSSTALNIFSGARIHPVDATLIGTFSALGIGVATIPFVAVFGEQITPLTILGFNAISYAFRVFLVGNAHHSHLWLTFGPTLGRLVSSPAYHQIHHSRDPRHSGKNFSAWIVLWDWLFGTQYVPGKYEKLSYGTTPEEDRHYTTLWALYLRPFVQCTKKLFFKFGKRQANLGDTRETA